MNVAVMQPYFLPYIGYFQLIGSVDMFVLCDNLQYAKRGWINRNRMLVNGTGRLFTLPLQRGSSFAAISGRTLAAGFDPAGLFHKFNVAYRRAPFYPETHELLETVLNSDERNLFGYVQQSIISLCAHLGIKTEFRVLSELPIDHAMNRNNKLFAICEAVGAKTYINTIGGMGYFPEEEFLRRGISLRFLKPGPVAYEQFGGEFVPWLSIVDCLMFNPHDEVRKLVSSHYDLIRKGA